MRLRRPLLVALASGLVAVPALDARAAPPPPPPFDDVAAAMAAAKPGLPDDLAVPADAADLSARSGPSQASTPDVLHVSERERSDRNGRNDELGDAERIVRLGTSRRSQDGLITGTLADVLPATPIGPFAEDDGAIPLANPTGLTIDTPTVRAAAAIGDGPHGTVGGDGSGDFDYYLVEGAAAGQVLAIDIDARAIGSALDAVVAVITTDGAILAFNDDSPELDSFVRFEVPAGGDYVVAVAAFGSLPTNPFDSGSGTGAKTEGAYQLTLSYEFAEDVDVYRLDLRAGDVVGAAVTGAGRVLELFDGSGTQVMGSGRDVSESYPDGSPLDVPGNATADHVAAGDGPLFLRVSRGPGEYQLDVRVRRPGIESDAVGARQILFLDFDGAFVDPSEFGTDSGDLSPMSDFLAGWALRPEDEDALIDAIVATFTENVQLDPQQRGGNQHFGVEIRTSRDHADPWGQPNVSRIVIGGTREELGFNTVGLAPGVDPGNFAREQTGVVLLDQASSPAGSGLATINDFAFPGVDVIGLVGQTLGFVASHEAGHILGNWHTAPANGVTSMMDTRDLDQLGLGPDVIFGTADDVDVDFVTDELIEGHLGAEDTMARVAFALSTGLPPRR